MFSAALLTMLQLSLPLSPAWTQDARAKLTECLSLAASDANAAEADARAWKEAGGSWFAGQCLGAALANQGRWSEAAAAFEAAAREAESARDLVYADCWAKAGNAWLVAGEFGKAAAALDAAIGSGVLLGTARGEAYLDRARARVAADQPEGARADLDLAILYAPEDPLAWLLSATLARRMNDLTRATHDIREALGRDPASATAQIEAGNIAALQGDEAGARTAWTRAIELAPGSPQAEAARKALEQFGSAQ